MERLKNQNCLVQITLSIWMILVNIVLNIFKVFKAAWNYCTKSIYHFFEVTALITHAVIIYKL